jgi:hypothetical protein
MEGKANLLMGVHVRSAGLWLQLQNLTEHAGFAVKNELEGHAT